MIGKEPVASDLPDWSFDSSEKSFSGKLLLQHGSNFHNEYQVKIVLSPDHPHSPPKVYEVGGRIPHLPERHINSDQSCCLFVEDETKKYWNPSVSLREFVDNTVRSHFVSQSYFELTGTWLHGERRHGIDGVVDFYREQFGIASIESIAKLIHLSAKERIKGHWHCPCGSGSKLRNCHFQNVLKIRELVPYARLKKLSDEFGKIIPSGS